MVDKKTTAKNKPKNKKSTSQPETAMKTSDSRYANQIKKSKKGLIIGLIAAAVVAIIGVVVAVLCFNETDPADPTANLNYSASFFINDNGKYTLWNADGQRLTEDEYSYPSDFIAGYAMVKKDDQYGIIKENGQMSVAFGKYGDITARGGLYLAQDGNTKEYSLLTGSGKELERGADLKISAPSYSSGFAIVESPEQIKVYNYEGKLIISAEKTDNAEESKYTNSHDFGLFYYDSYNTIFDARDGKILAEFEGPRYEFDSITDDRKMILLQESDNDNYKLIANDRVYDLNETKYYGLTDLDDVIGFDNYSELALLDDDYRVVRRVSTYIALKDANNYAAKGENGNVEIYYKGEKIKEFGDDSSVSDSGVLYEDYYAIAEGDKARFYNLDGTVGIDHEYLEIASLFDKNHHAVVSNTENEYYFIDTKGNRIGDAAFKKFRTYEGGYELMNSDGKYAIANKDGKLLTDFKYEDVYYRSNAKPHNIWTGEVSEDKYDIIDVDSGEVLLEDVDTDSFQTNYFTVKSDNKLEYYTYEGKLFYTVEKENS